MPVVPYHGPRHPTQKLTVNTFLASTLLPRLTAFTGEPAHHHRAGALDALDPTKGRVPHTAMHYVAGGVRAENVTAFTNDPQMADKLKKGRQCMHSLASIHVRCVDLRDGAAADSTPGFHVFFLDTCSHRRDTQRMVNTVLPMLAPRAVLVVGITRSRNPESFEAIESRLDLFMREHGGVPCFSRQLHEMSACAGSIMLYRAYAIDASRSPARAIEACPGESTALASDTVRREYARLHPARRAPLCAPHECDGPRIGKRVARQRQLFQPGVHQQAPDAPLPPAVARSRSGRVSKARQMYTDEGARRSSEWQDTGVMVSHHKPSTVALARRFPPGCRVRYRAGLHDDAGRIGIVETFDAREARFVVKFACGRYGCRAHDMQRVQRRRAC